MKGDDDDVVMRFVPCSRPHVEKEDDEEEVEEDGEVKWKTKRIKSNDAATGNSIRNSFTRLKINVQI